MFFPLSRYTDIAFASLNFSVLWFLFRVKCHYLVNWVYLTTSQDYLFCRQIALTYSYRVNNKY
jgi:hypothetical protein